MWLEGRFHIYQINRETTVGFHTFIQSEGGGLGQIVKSRSIIDQSIDCCIKCRDVNQSSDMRRELIVDVDERT